MDLIFGEIGTVTRVLEIVTVGIYRDLSNVISASQKLDSGIFSIVAVVLKYLITFLALYSIASLIAGRIGVDRKFALAASLAVMAVAAATVANPSEMMKNVDDRIGKYLGALSDGSVRGYVPTLIKGIHPIEEVIKVTWYPVDYVTNKIPSNVTVPTLSPGLKSTEVDVSWIKTVFAIIFAALLVYLVSKFSKVAALIVASIYVTPIFGVTTDMQSVITTIIASIVGAYFLISRKLIPLSIYPISIAIVLIMYLIQPPVNVLTVVLSALIIATLYPMFYLMSVAFYGVEEIVEKREKLGMKVKPKKYLEEQTGYWDIDYAAFVMTVVFAALIAIYGVNLIGLGTYAGFIYYILRS